MAMGNSPLGSGRRRSSRRGKRASLSEINVTPMVDVMLVLLIIFMISAPLLTSGIKIDLPKSEAAALKDEGDPITVSIDIDGNIYVGTGGHDDKAGFDQLAPRLLAITNGDTSKPIYVRGAGAATWETVAKVMGRLSKSGFVHINLLTETMGAGAASASSSSSAAAAPSAGGEANP
jgi:biopolymer transport protein TolR